MDENTTTPETEVGDLTVEQAAQEMLSRWTKRDQPEEPTKEAPTEEAQPEPEQAQADAPAEEGATEETADEDGEDEIDVAGEKFKVPRALSETAKKIAAKAKEVEAGSTRRFQEAAELRKAVDTERAAVADMRKITEATADLLADHRTVARRLQQLEQVDIQNTDTDTLTRLNAEYNRLLSTKTRIEQEYQAKVAEVRAKDTEALRARMEHAEKVVSTRLKGWGPEMKKSLAEYAMKMGAPAQALEGISEPWMVEILADAAYGRQMREHKTAAEKRVVQTQPTLKPGASAKVQPAAAKAKEAEARLRKTGSTDDFVAALLARSQARKK